MPRGIGGRPHIEIMILDLSNEQAATLANELTAIIENDRYFLSPRIRMLREIRKHDPPRTETRSAPRAQTLRAPTRRTIPQTGLDETRNRPTNDARERGGCPCSAGRMVPGMPPSS